MRVYQPEGLKNLGSTSEPSVPTSSSPCGRGGVYGCPVSGRAPDPKGPLDLGHQRNVRFVSTTLQGITKHVSAFITSTERSGEQNRKTHHVTELTFRVSPPVPSGVRVREGGFEPSSDAIWVASPQWVPEPCPPRGGGGDWGTTTARREKGHDDRVWVMKVEGRV